MTMMRDLYAVAFALCALAASTCPASAQASESDWNFLREITEVTNSISKETAREARTKCAELGKRLETMQVSSPLQRLYFEAEIDSCVFQAMNNGEFSDETGDQCSYHFSYAQKLSQVVIGARGNSGISRDLMGNFASRLENAARMAPDFGCKSDYSGFEEAIAFAQEEAARPEPEAPFKLWDDINAATNALTAENARDVQKTCAEIAGEIGKVPERSKAERLFYEGLVADCTARAMTVGKFADDTGDACAHHFRFATIFSEAIAAAASLPPQAEFIAEVMRGELQIAKRQGPEMGCKQDYASLKE